VYCQHPWNADSRTKAAATLTKSIIRTSVKTATALGRVASQSLYPEWKQEKLFYKAWLYSLERNHRGVAYTPAPWGPGPTLGIGCYKKDNPHIQTTP
jgi:hypothetical protein